MSNQTNILLGIIALVLVGHSWWIHFKVKDGIARKMFLWGCGFLFAFIFMRTLGFVLVDFGILDIYQSRTWNMYNVWWIYALVVGQYILQNWGEK